MTSTALAADQPAVPATLPQTQKPRTRFDLANYREQIYGDTAIGSYTLMISTSTGHGMSVRTYNESRVMVRFPDGWRVVHVHKSPTWSAPLLPPTIPDPPA